MPLTNIVFQVLISGELYLDYLSILHDMIHPLKFGSKDWVYRTLVIFDIEVNSIPHCGSGRNFPHYQRNFCLYVFSPTAPLSQVPVNFGLTTFTKTLLLSIRGFPLFLWLILDFRSHILSIEVKINDQLYKQGKISHN